ncbi:SMP-30/Gluconolaconase/LRE-like region [Rhizoctonia solani]|uniref:SMP-30/Gluconolaconase/LRE-like region n=1 Tax=Rhizoctonia solani TaxID=456999 RepID=A0A8H7I741_9AGAM|nr:SMP-30/Gluconolaconase/LRE-like region [Rhizoctonia solani]
MGSPCKPRARDAQHELKCSVVSSLFTRSHQWLVLPRPSYSLWSTVYVNASGNVTTSGPFTYPNASTPFVASVSDFYDVVGDGASLEVVARAEYAAFHEAGVYISSTNEVYFTSNKLNTTNATEYRFPSYGQFSKISLTPSPNGTYEWSTLLPPSDQLVMPNGGTVYNGQVLMAAQGYGLDVASSLGFNSINDVAVLFANRAVDEQWVFFTDPPYGYFQGFKPYPSLPLRYTPSTHRQFSEDYKTCYISDTGFISAVAGDPHPADGRRPGTIYAYDVVAPPEGADPKLVPPTLTNRRVFAFADSGMPDGIKVDTAGNVYAGCFDGVHVWNKHGALLGKILLGLDELTETSDGVTGKGCSNLVFVPGGLLMFSEDRMYLAKIKAKGALLA